MKQKDSYWFRHDSSAGRGLRMRKMAHIYGHWGKGIYWDVIEILRDQSNYRFNSDESSLQLLSDLIGCKDEIKFISWFNDCVNIELFIIEDGVFFSEVLCKNMANWETKKTNGGEGGRGNKKLNESEKKAKPKLNESIREEKRREEDIITASPKPKKISFNSSNIFDKLKFKECYPTWEKEKLIYYYEAALRYSNEGNKYVDWEAAIRNWAKKDELNGKITFKPKQILRDNGLL